MAIIKYPDWLPLAQRASKNLTQQTPFRSDQPAVGAPIFQKLTTDIAATWSLTWIFTLAEERAFIQWLRSPSYLNKCNNWFTMMIDLGGSGLQEQTLHFTDYPVQTSIDGGVVTWTGNVIAKKLNNTMDEFDDVLVEMDYRWYSWLDEVVNRELPQVYMTPILHMPINMLSSTLDSRIVYNGPRVYYINRNGNLVQSAANEWPLTFIDGVAVGRVPPEDSSSNLFVESDNPLKWNKSPALGITTSLAGTTGKPTGTCTASITRTDPYNVILSNYYSRQLEQPLTMSCRIKGDNSRCRLRFGTTDGFKKGVLLDLASGMVTGAISGGGLPSGTSYYLRKDSDGFYYFSATLSATESAEWSGGIQMVPLVGDTEIIAGATFDLQMVQVEAGATPTSYIPTTENTVTRPSASAKVVMSGATSIDITYSDGSVVNVQAVDGYASIPQSNSAWGSKYITTIKFNV